MALIKCNKCGKEISDKSTKCINCGNRLKKREFKYKSIIIIGIICIVVIVIALIIKFLIKNRDDTNTITSSGGTFMNIVFE